MTTNSMSCELFADQLMAYLERETDDATRSAMERHAVTCAECGALLADLRTLRIDAANLPEMHPARDLWAGIAERIEAPVVSIGQHLPEGAAWVAPKDGRGLRRFLRGVSIAAGLVLAAGVGYFARGAAPTTSAPVADVDLSDTTMQVAIAPETILVPVTPPLAERRVASVEPPAPAPAVTQVARPLEVQNAARVVATLAADYDREILRLQRLIDERRNQLDPVTVGIIEKNLKVIDTAITECKKAIANDPASGFLIESLNQSLRSKVELMRTAALLPSRT
jgi:hypothetical protein